jgi:hypothetical protein
LKLSQLIPQYHTLNHAERVALVRAYRTRRAADIESYKENLNTPKKRSNSTGLSDEEKALVKLLGITQKQFLLLKAAQPVEEEEEDEGDNTDDE